MSRKSQYQRDRPTRSAAYGQREWHCRNKHRGPTVSSYEAAFQHVRFSPPRPRTEGSLNDARCLCDPMVGLSPSLFPGDTVQIWERSTSSQLTLVGDVRRCENDLLQCALTLRSSKWPKNHDHKLG